MPSYYDALKVQNLIRTYRANPMMFDEKTQKGLGKTKEKTKKNKKKNQDPQTDQLAGAGGAKLHSPGPQGPLLRHVSSENIILRAVCVSKAMNNHEQ